MQKLDAAYKEVTYFRNIVTFDTEIKQSFPHRSDSETGRILLVSICCTRMTDIVFGNIVVVVENNWQIMGVISSLKHA